MNRQKHTEPREIIVAEAIRDVVNELRMVDLADYVAFLRMGRMANISDIVDSAAELYFMPGTVKLGYGGEARVCWSTPPKIVLDLELKPRGATIYLTLEMGEKDAGIEVNYVAFDRPATDPLENTAFLETAIRESRLLPAEARFG